MQRECKNLLATDGAGYNPESSLRSLAPSLYTVLYSTIKETEY